MWSATEVLAGLVPNCICGASYDLRFCAPHSLPCAHTFCLMCLSKENQRKKRRCPSCRKKYSSFVLNSALAEVVKRVRQRRECLEQRSLRCDECDSRRSATAMRRCLSCSRAMNKHMSAGLTLDCVICLECCVNRHNGHELTNLPSLPCSSYPSPPVASSTPRNDSQRNLPWGRFLRTERQRMQGRSAHRRINRPKPHHSKPRVPTASSMIDDELVYEARSPLYYQIQQSAVEDISISTGVAKQLSGLVISVTGVCNTTSKQEEPVYLQKLANSPDSGILATSDGSTTDRKDSDVSPYQSISPYAAAFPGYSLCSTLKLEKTESSSIYQRVTPILRLKGIFARKPSSFPCLRS